MVDLEYQLALACKEQNIPTVVYPVKCCECNLHKVGEHWVRYVVPEEFYGLSSSGYCPQHLQKAMMNILGPELATKGD